MSPEPVKDGGAPRRIVVTGADGLIGFHLRAFLFGRPGVAVLPVDRSRFHAAEQLADDLRGADAVVHLAGMNRGDDEELESTNLRLAQILLDHLEALDSSAHLVFASSTHRDLDTAYGRSKRRTGQLLASRSSGRSRYTELVLPNVFGEFGRPYHNSAVSTFCHQLVLGDEPKVLEDREIEWLHAQRVACEIVDLIDRELTGEHRLAGTPRAVSELLNGLRRMDSLYRRQILPPTTHEFERDLFNTYRSYLPLNRLPIPLDAHRDDRGDLVEVVKSHGRGQCFLSTTRPGVTRGEHFHRRKFERFLVVEGTARIRLRKLFRSLVTEFELRGERPAYVDIPTFHTHDLTNTGSGTLVTLFWADEIFDAERPDTVHEAVAA